MIYTYAIVRRPTETLVLPEGLRSPLTWNIAGDLAALVETDLALETLETDNEFLLQAVVHHDRVVRYLFARMTVLPLRFGTYFLSPERLHEHLSAGSQGYERELQRLGGRAEFALKLFPAEAPTADSATTDGGRAYFLAKKQRHQNLQTFKARQQAEKAALMAAIAADGAEICPLDPDESGTERLCFLGNRAGVTGKAWERWRAIAPSWHLQVSEALPPYHFVRALADGASSS